MVAPGRAGDTPTIVECKGDRSPVQDLYRGAIMHVTRQGPSGPVQLYSGRGLPGASCCKDEGDEEHDPRKCRKYRYP